LSVSQGIARALDSVEADAAIRAVVIMGAAGRLSQAPTSRISKTSRKAAARRAPDA